MDQGVGDDAFLLALVAAQAPDEGVVRGDHRIPGLGMGLGGERLAVEVLREVVGLGQQVDVLARKAVDVRLPVGQALADLVEEAAGTDLVGEVRGQVIRQREELGAQHGGLDGVQVDACGYVWVTEYTLGYVWRFPPTGGDPELAVETGTFWIPNMHWGNGIGGWEEDVMYMQDRFSDELLVIPVGIPGAPVALEL